MAILMSAAFAQTMQKKVPVSVSSSTAMMSTKTQQSKQLNPQIAEKLGIDASKKQVAAPFRSKKPSLKHRATYASGDPEKAKIKLVVGDCWGDGSGYQLLLDSKALLCNDLEEGLDQSNLRYYYDMADVKLPADASPVIGSTSVLDFESDSIEIAPGVYDVLVVNPSEGEDEGEEVHVYIASGNSVLDDFEFVKGYTYVFELELGDMYDNCTLLVPFELSVSPEPVLSCEVGTEAEIKITVSNEGNADVENFEIWYYVADEEDEAFEPDTVRQTVSGTLKSGKKETYTFTAKVENVQADSLYVVYVGVTPLAGELETENNVTAGCFIQKEAQTTLPYEFDLENYDFVPSSPTAWGIGETEDGDYIAQADEIGSPLVSKCFELEADKVYRLSFDYWAGMLLFIFEIPESFHVGFGLTSESMSEWETVFEQEYVIIEDWTSADVLLKPKATGTYAVYFSADYYGFMGLRNITVAEVADKDARLNSFKSGLARLMPAKQANGKTNATVSVQNRGKLTMDATVEIKMDGKEVGKGEVKNIGTDSIVDVNIEMNISDLKLGDKPKFVVAVNLEGEEETELKDNTKEWQMEVGDYVMAYDYVTEDMYEDGYHAIGTSSVIGCGIPFTLLAKDTLTAVSLGWIEMESDMNVGITIHKWNSATETLGDLIYETKVRRGTTGGQIEYKVPSIILEAGEYMISAIQTGSVSYGLIVDRKQGGGLYITTYTPAVYQNNLGTPAIRAVFGPDAAPMAKDVFVQEITKPKELGLFAENQEVVAEICNQGYEAVEAPLSLMVNGKLVATQKVELAAYGRAEVKFIADLSALSTEYVLTVFSALEGDADITNDTCTKTVRSMGPSNPYVMDFEHCRDFAIENFTPAWKTVDVDGDETYGFSGLEFPHAEEAFAFIAFNPGAIGLTGAEAHSGDRFGASFASYAGVNDDWLISPKLKIVAGKEYMNFFVKTYMDDYGLEKYNVLVSTTDDNPESFVKIGQTREAPAEDWEEVNIDLKEYSGKEVYLAIQCVSEDAFIFMIDDITVCTKVANEDVARLETQLSVYPNPAHEMITIQAQDAVINQVAVFNVAGMMVYQSNGLNTSEYRYSVKGLNAGIYFARVATEQGTAVMKFVVR